MKEDKKHLNIDLDFLDKKEDGKSVHKKKAESKTDKKESTDKQEDTVSNDAFDTGYKYNWKTIGVIAVIVLFFGWAIFSGNSTETNSTKSSYNPPVQLSDTSNTASKDSVTSNTSLVTDVKSDSQICKDNYGSHSYANGKKNSSGGPECDCQKGYTWNSDQTSCVVAPPPPKSNYEICQDRNGPFTTYNANTNSCECLDGYALGKTSNQCVSVVTARNESCAADWPNTSWLKYDSTSGKNICDCKAGYYWDNNQTACYSLSSFNQSCQASYGQGSISTTENGKRVCDCGYGYSFNAQRTMCVTTASINAICERDVGRNSIYTGTVTNGKYDCTQPY